MIILKDIQPEIIDLNNPTTFQKQVKQQSFNEVLPEIQEKEVNLGITKDQLIEELSEIKDEPLDVIEKAIDDDNRIIDKKAAKELITEIIK